MDLGTILKLLIIICSTVMFIVTVHEFTHILISVCFGYKPIGIKILCFLFLNGRMYFHFKNGMLGGAIINYSVVNSIESEKRMQKNIRINMIITYAVHIIEIIVTLLLCFIFKNIYIYAICSITFIVSICIFVSSFDIGGDFYLFNKIGVDKSLSASFIASPEILLGFKNEYAFKRVQFCLLNSNTEGDLLIILMNYYINYCLYFGIQYKNEILNRFLKTTLNTNEQIYAKKHILEKFYLWTAIYNIPQIEIVDEAITDYIKKLIAGLNIDESEITLELGHKFYKNNFYYKEFTHDIYCKINNL